MKIVKSLFFSLAIVTGILLITSCGGKPEGSKLIDEVVQTAYGQLQGVPNTDMSVMAFKGIPYAAPPVGDLRWKAPQPPQSWEGIRDASGFCASCMQNRAFARNPWTEEFMVQDSISEDCLFLNIWTPAQTANDKIPVLVYIHGGGFTEGSGSVEVYDGEELAKKGIIVVTINYRLGIFGFFVHPELTAESEHQASGNYGLLDQVAALNWIQGNISAFGGDPERVTIAGQSAGAASIHLLVASPLAQGLFHGGIAESGSGMRNLSYSTPLAEAEKNGLSFAGLKGASSLADLRAMPAGELMAPIPDQPFLRFGACVDGWFLPKDMRTIFENGEQNDVPFLTGIQSDEGSSSPMYGKITLDQFVENAKRTYGEKAQTFLSLYPAKTDEEAGEMSKEQARESSRVSMFDWAAFRAKTATQPVYTYYFDRGIPWPEHPEFAAFHTGEVPYVFHNLKFLDRPWTSVDSLLTETVSSYWVNFVSKGDPNGEGLPEWPAFDPEKKVTMRLGEKVEVMPLTTDEKYQFFTSF